MFIYMSRAPPRRQFTDRSALQKTSLIYLLMIPNRIASARIASGYVLPFSKFFASSDNSSGGNSPIALFKMSKVSLSSQLPLDSPPTSGAPIVIVKFLVSYVLIISSQSPRAADQSRLTVWVRCAIITGSGSDCLWFPRSGAFFIKKPA